MPLISGRYGRLSRVIVGNASQELNIVDLFEIQGFSIEPAREIKPLS
jgi:hypothetical protein